VGVTNYVILKTTKKKKTTTKQDKYSNIYTPSS
jgi:hypothetical protein